MKKLDSICTVFGIFGLVPSRAPLATLCLVLLGILLSEGARAQIILSEETVERGREVQLRLSEPVDHFVVIDRPNSALTERDTFSVDPPSDVLSWTPERAGIVRLEAGEESLNVSVRFQGVSGTGLMVMFLAGTLLFGGAVFAFRLLFSDP